MKKEEKLFQAINSIDKKFLAEAETEQATGKALPLAVIIPVAAACLVLGIGACIMVMRGAGKIELTATDEVGNTAETLVGNPDTPETGVGVETSSSPSGDVTDYTHLYEDVLYVPGSDIDGHTPTGFPPEVIPEPVIMIDGELFQYKFTERRNTLGDGYSFIGTILEVNVYKMPEEDFCATGAQLPLHSGLAVYSSDKNKNEVVVSCEDGYYPFFNDQ